MADTGGGEGGGGGAGNNNTAISCAFCGAPANQRCTGCHVTFYCCKEHQKQHWKKHKTSCCAYKICISNTLGRFIVATRDLKPGELVLTEVPLIVAPLSYSMPTCLVCYRPVTGKYKCKKCGWPMCNEACAQSECHTPECVLSVKHRKKPVVLDPSKMNQPNAMYEIVALFRCLYMKFINEDRYNNLLRLEAHTKARIQIGRIEKDRVMLRMIREYFAIPADEFSDDEILDIMGILYVNTHEVPITPMATQALYQNASLVEHSCINNASKHFDMNGNLQIRAAVHIRKGDHISIQYSDPMWSTFNRQQHLYETKFFSCQCKRCSDPSELGTHFSSLKCPKCASGGYLVPDDPHQQEICPWSCTVCGEGETSEYVNAVIKAIGEELIRLEKGIPEACAGFIKKHSQNLHPNHYYLMDVKLALSQMMGKIAGDPRTNVNDFPEVSEKDLVMKQKMSMELLEVANVISPGISRLRGVIIYELQSTLSMFARKKYAKGEITVEHLKNIMQEVRKYLKECIHIFSFEPTCIQEGRLTAIARLDLVEIETFVDSVDKKAGGKNSNKK